MRSTVRRMGNSAAVIIPKPVLQELGLAAGDPINLALEHGKLVLSPARGAPRSGWAEASIRLADSGDDGLLWPEFANVDDAALKW